MSVSHYHNFIYITHRMKNIMSIHVQKKHSKHTVKNLKICKSIERYES